MYIYIYIYIYELYELHLLNYIPSSSRSALSLVVWRLASRSFVKSMSYY